MRLCYRPTSYRAHGGVNTHSDALNTLWLHTAPAFRAVTTITPLSNGMDGPFYRLEGGYAVARLA
jgi:hypothetical protein